MATITVQQPWLSFIAEGSKTVEGRTGPAWKHTPGPTTFTDGDTIVRCNVSDVLHYPDLEEYLHAHWKDAAPQAASIDEARELYLSVRKGDVLVFAPERVSEKGGICALVIAV